MKDASPGQRGGNAFGDGAGGQRIGTGQQQHELLPAIAGHHVSRLANGLAQAVGHRDQAVVPLQMAVVIVEAFEEVHVQQQDGKLAVLLSRLLQDLLADVVEMAPVGQPGQRIPLGHGIELAGQGQVLVLTGHRQFEPAVEHPPARLQHDDETAHRHPVHRRKRHLDQQRLQQQKQQRRGAEAVEQPHLAIERHQRRHQQHADEIERQAETASQLHQGDGVAEQRPASPPQQGAGTQAGLPDGGGLAGEPVPEQRKRQAGQRHQHQLHLVAPGQYPGHHQMGVLIDIEARQQEQDRQLVDGPEPAQPLAQGVATRLIQMVIEVAGETTLFIREHVHTCLLPYKSLALAADR